MSGAYFHFTEDQLREAGKRHVEQGASDMRMRADRQADVDGALNFLLSDACKKLRTDPKPAQAPARSVLDVEAQRHG